MEEKNKTCLCSPLIIYMYFDAFENFQFPFGLHLFFQGLFFPLEVSGKWVEDFTNSQRVHLLSEHYNN